MSNCVKIATERGEFIMAEDGYHVWVPVGHGFITANDLRELAGELDRLNTDWDDIVSKTVGG